MITKCKTY